MTRDEDKILLAHGGGGELTSQLVADVILAGLGGVATGSLDDAAVLDVPGRLAFTTDSFVVKPLFFPGGDIGRLAVCGTVNDLSMRGARPLFVSLAFILEEGLEIGVLRRVVASIRIAAEEARIKVATGDTKVVERGHADGLFINTSGVGAVADGVNISLRGARSGDEILVSGPMGNHAIAVLATREGMAFQTTVESDCAPLNHLASALLAELGGDLHVMNDPTRGGLAMSLNTIASASGVAMEVDEQSVPVDSAVAFASEMLGLDVLALANEGKLVAIVSRGAARRAETVMKKAGARPARIGTVKPGKGVTLRSAGGGRRILEIPYGEDAPRIC